MIYRPLCLRVRNSQGSLFPTKGSPFPRAQSSSNVYGFFNITQHKLSLKCLTGCHLGLLCFLVDHSTWSLLKPVSSQNHCCSSSDLSFNNIILPMSSIYRQTSSRFRSLVFSSFSSLLLQPLRRTSLVLTWIWTHLFPLFIAFDLVSV